MEDNKISSHDLIARMPTNKDEKKDKLACKFLLIKI